MCKSAGTAGFIHNTTKMCIFSVSTLIMILTLSLLFSPGTLWAAPFSRHIQFTQPDNTQITLWGEGDEFHAVFETTTGYTVVFDPQRQAYYYAERSSDGKNLLSTGVPAHYPAPQTLERHLRIYRDAVAAAAGIRQKQWNEDTGLTKRWAQLKAQNLGTPLPPDEAGALPAPPSTTTVGTKVGLTLLIDFSDDQATISQSDINSFLNGDSYTGYGNNGSVKKYFSDVSGSRLTYTNVVTIYVRMAQPKSYYNNTGIDNGIQGRLLINDALTILKARGDYNSSILPTFSSLTTDASGNVLGFNVYFAGADSGVWSYGLWPHSWSLSSSVALGNGKSVYRYQMTNVGSSLELGTFCHENGHMLCGFPDLYDYDYDAKGGAGEFSLMGYGGDGTNPSQVDAYLKLAAGWATVTDLDSDSSLTKTLSAAPNSGYDNFYRYRRAGVATEYFLLENRQKTGRDAGLPAAGIAVWHVDELGDRDNQSMTPNSSHLNYELTLVQADNLWHFESDSNSGDASDLYYQGNSAAAYTNRLDDATTTPNAHWWDGSGSGMSLNTFSVVGQSMTFKAAVVPPTVTSTSPAGGATGVALNSVVTATFSKAMNSSTINATTFTLNNGATGTVTYNASTYIATFTPSATLSANTSYTATITTGVTDEGGNHMAAAKTWNFTTTDGTSLLVNGDFESDLSGWATAQVSGTSGGWNTESSGLHPSGISPHGGGVMARFNSYSASSGAQTRLYQTSGIAIPSTAVISSLSFWMYHDTGYTSSPDQLQVQVSTNGGSSWNNVGSPVVRYDGTTGWSQVTLDLSAYKGQPDVMIGFLGISYYGNDIYLDDVKATVILTLTVNFAGSGSGTVTINPLSTSCNVNCTKQVASSTALTLHATPGGNSTFSGWSGNCSGAGDCTLTMNADKSVTSTFTNNSSANVHLLGGGYYDTFQSAYIAAAASCTILAKAVELAGNFTANLGKTVLLEGGYDSGYLTNSGGYTVIDGILTIQSGSMTIENLTIR